MQKDQAIRRKLIELRQQSQEVDHQIADLGETGLFDQLRLRRLKRHKQTLDDEISRLEDSLTPDIIA